jgi:predicted nucleic acid-binding protein
MISVADTSFILAYLNKADSWHEACMNVLKAHRTIYLPQSTLAEIAYMLGRSIGNKRVSYFLRNLPAVPLFKVEPLTAEDFVRVADILDQYADSRIDFVDASVAAVAERLKITRILTLDKRDFNILRPNHIPHFEVLP